MALIGADSDGCEAQRFDVGHRVPRRERPMQVRDAMFHRLVLMHDEGDRGPSEAVRAGTINT